MNKSILWLWLEIKHNSKRVNNFMEKSKFFVLSFLNLPPNKFGTFCMAQSGISRAFKVAAKTAREAVQRVSPFTGGWTFKTYCTVKLFPRP